MYKLQDLISETSRINLERYRKQCQNQAKNTFKMLFKLCRTLNVRYRLDNKGRIKKVKLHDKWYKPYLEDNVLMGSTNQVYSEFGKEPSEKKVVSNNLFRDLLHGTPLTMEDLYLV